MIQWLKAAALVTGALGSCVSLAIGAFIATGDKGMFFVVPALCILWAMAVGYVKEVWFP